MSLFYLSHVIKSGPIICQAHCLQGSNLQSHGRFKWRLTKWMAHSLCSKLVKFSHGNRNHQKGLWSLNKYNCLFENHQRSAAYILLYETVALNTTSRLLRIPKSFKLGHYSSFSLECGIIITYFA